MMLKFICPPRPLPLLILPLPPPRPPPPEIFSFLHLPIYSDIYLAKIYYFCCLFCLFVALISSFLQRQFSEWSCLIFCDKLAITRFSLVALS